MDPMGDVVQVVHSEDYFEKRLQLKEEKAKESARNIGGCLEKCVFGQIFFGIQHSNGKSTIWYHVCPLLSNRVDLGISQIS